jgi:hypothetical protein
LWIENEIEAVKTARRDSYNGVRLAGKRDKFAEDGRIGGETVLPEAMTEDDDRHMPFVGGETAAAGHAGASDVEIVGGGGLSPDALRFAGASDGGGNEFKIGSNAGKGFGVVANVGVDGIGEIVAALLAIVRGVESEERGRITDGGGAEDEAADDGEDGGIGGDAEAD